MGFLRARSLRVSRFPTAAKCGHSRPLPWPSKLVPTSPGVQLTTDGHKVYLEAVEGANGAQSWTTRGLVKLCEGDSGQRQPEARYRPAQRLGTRRVRIAGDPDPHHLSTSFAERQNLSVRMGMRRFTGLTREVAQEHGRGGPAPAHPLGTHAGAPARSDARASPLPTL